MNLHHCSLSQTPYLSFILNLCDRKSSLSFIMSTTSANSTQKPNQNGFLLCIKFFVVTVGMMVAQTVSCFQTTLPIACRGKNTSLNSRLISAAREFQLPLSKVEATRSTIDTLESRARTAIAGKISFFLSKLVVNKTKLQKIAASLEIHIDPREVAALIVLSFFSVPTAHLLFKLLGSSSANVEQNVKVSDTESTDFFQDSSDTSPWGDLIRWIAPSRHMRGKYFYKSLIFQTADHISQISKLGIIVYAFDLCLIFLTDLGFSVTTHLHHIFPKTLYTVWLAGRLKRFKKYMLKRSFSNNSTQIYLYDRIINLIIYATTVTILLEIYSIEWGVALSSLFAFGGLSTFLFGLASKDLVSQLVNSIALTASNNFHEGESIIIGDGKDGVKGVVVKLGWLHTLIRGNYSLSLLN